ncbi:hypothetical protein [Pseudomonas sichuanensis]|uniref:hypothetical protein n=1 Tax=Pseudomonas sichuanensis TaxID=2213015 RepID=UPI000DA6633E|nr:hypothetical protein [Pseudomonas sichuanensis]
MRLLLITLAIFPLLASASPRYVGDAIQPLIEKSDQLNDQCRGGSGDKKETLDACDARDKVISEINSRGWCYGGDYQIQANKEWRPCSSTIPPKFDPEIHCDRVGAVTGAPSELIKNGCLKSEQESYNAVKRKWADIPDATQKHCTTVALTQEGGSYMILYGCLQQEAEAKKSNSSFKFKY